MHGGVRGRRQKPPPTRSCERYEKKVELFQRWQSGQDLNPRKSYNRGIERSARVQNKELQIEEEEELER